MLKRRCYSTPSVVVVCGALIMCVRIAATTARHVIGDENKERKTVTLIVHVTDKRGNPVPPASFQPVEVTEHGEKLQLVSGPKNAGPAQVGFLIDSNFHQRNVLQLEKQTLETLFLKLKKEKARAFVMNYGTGIRSSGPLTEDWDGLKNFNRSIEADLDKRNYTILLFDALKRAIDTLSDGPGTRAIVLFAEGNGYGNSVTWKTVARLAEQEQIACYVVLFADHTFYGTKSIRHYGRDLVELVPQTGGEFWEAGSSSHKAAEVAQKIVREIDSQSLLEVTPSVNRGDTFHRVKVTFRGRRLDAQAGYFDH